jgi:UDPglucose--hexose-1-phosphate uridylyltransferase
MTIRRHVITGQPVVFAPERAGRPHAFIDDDREELCPFCPGNEAQTPPETLRVGDTSGWRVRAFSNKYPAVADHEVIVESPDHDADFDSIEDAAAVVRVYTDRYRALSSTPGGQYVALFKNHGRSGGASIRHIHSQIMALPFLPPRVAVEGAAFARAPRCPLCAAIASHRSEGLIIRETASFIWLAPAAPTFAYQQWLVPKRHLSEMAGLGEEEMGDMASLLQAATKAMRGISPSHNWLFLNFPRQASAHAYVDLFPRVTSVAGFELETGTYIDVVDPATTVRVMR